MSKFANLMEEVEFVRDNCADEKCGILEAIMFIDDNRDQYSSQIIRELDMFLREGARMFA